MLTNWRTSLLFSKLSFVSHNEKVTEHDIYSPAEYIVFDTNKLKTNSVLQWAKDNFEAFGFDFDRHSMVAWPIDDTVNPQLVVDDINKHIPRFASIRCIPPVLAHGLDDITFDATGKIGAKLTDFPFELIF